MKVIIEPRVVDLKSVLLAKIDYTGHFQGIGKVYQNLMSWAKTNNFSSNKTITIYWNDPNIVGFNNVSQSACIITHQTIKEVGEIKNHQLPAQKCFVGRFEVSYFEFPKAWKYTTQKLKENNLKEKGTGNFEVFNSKKVIDICIPVES